MAKYFFIAGEASGDLHASRLIEALHRCDPQSAFTGLGGDKMRDAGCTLVQDYRKMAYMGVVAVLRNLKQIRLNFRLAEDALLHNRPDVLVLVDYPGFNLRMAQFCRRHLPATKIVYFIPPAVWAWKTWRIHKIVRLSDLLLGIFPFEPAFYARYGYTCEYVGNPTVDAIQAWKKTAPVRNEAALSPIIAILPGSRPSEISHCLPIMLQAARQVAQRCNAEIAVTAAPGVDDAFYAPYLNGEKLTRDTYALLSQARAAIVNSGTATLETALLGCPQTAVYYVAFLRWLGWLQRILFRIPRFTLVNIIPNKEVIQEMIGWRFTHDEIERELMRLMTDEDYRRTLQTEYTGIAALLGDGNAADNAAQHIIRLLSNPK